MIRFQAFLTSVWIPALCLFAKTNAQNFGEFNVFKEHPLSRFLSKDNMPVVLNKYYFTNTASPDSNTDMRREAKFIPGAACYRKGGKDDLYFDNVDALMVQTSANHKLTVHLNYPAKVTLILNSVSRKELSNPIEVTSPSGWKTEGFLFAEEHKGAKAPKRRDHERLLDEGFAISKMPVKDGEKWTLDIPRPQEFKLLGLDSAPTQYSVLFSNEDNSRFDYPETPKALLRRLRGKSIKANKHCPEQLHRLWVTYSKDLFDNDNYIGGNKKSNRLIPRKTWHPLIDPVFWCTYGHDHGSYPGPYKPAFHHTSWKTKDSHTRNGRQAESNEGFKVFAFFERNFHWIITVHMELNNPRRFSTRHHTTQIAIFDQQWKGLAFLNLKQDFGFAATRVFLKGKKGKSRIEALTAEDVKIRKEMSSRPLPHTAFRQFNVISKNHCQFQNRMGAIKTRPNKSRRGSNEHWLAPLQTCSNREGFKIDISKPHTSLKTCRTSGRGVAARLHGGSIGRTFTSRGKGGFTVSSELCSWIKQLPSSKTKKSLKLKWLPRETHPMIKFYTDSYFEKVLCQHEVDKGVFHLSQWMKPGFSASLPRGTYIPNHPWHGYFVRKKSKQSKGQFSDLDSMLVESANR